MEAVVHLDTHVVAWLIEGRLDKLGKRARRRLERSRPRISPIVQVELDFLFEIGRTDRRGQQAIMHLGRTVGLRMDDAAFADVAHAAGAQSWTRDPFDRVIVAHAALAATPLLTADHTMLEHYPQAIDATR